jgi:hypothetical protein
MTKPIGHYTSYTPGDRSYLESLQERYGSFFEKITKREKLFLVSSLASQLCGDASGETRNEIYEVGVEIQQCLPISDQEGLLEALVAQIRWGQSNAEPVHHS